MNKFYITTTLPYVNGDPHIGFALEIVEADVLARWHKKLGDEVFFNTGTDEHGLKVWRRAQELEIEIQVYCDEEVKKWKKLKELLNLSFSNFIRTSDRHHIKAAQEFWRICDKNGYIYKKNYKVKYCVGCELEKTESELVDGKCLLHPDLEIEIIEEENYFFKFSEFQGRLIELFEKNPEFVLPEKKFNEIKKFVERGLKDFSVSRLKSKMPWGIEVPGDSGHVMYVWFDALINYISAIGWPDDLEKFNCWWPGYQIAGKDNLRQQSTMWQAMLMAAGLPTSKQILIHGFVMGDGHKMSKSLGNIISPEDMVKRFGVDGTRYLLLTISTFGEDVDVSVEHLTEKYNADLANGLGNLVSRVIKLNENIKAEITVKSDKKLHENIDDVLNELSAQNLLGGGILSTTWEQIAWANKNIEDVKLWELVKSNREKAKKELSVLFGVINWIGNRIEPFMPETSQKIAEILKTGEAQPLFPRV